MFWKREAESLVIENEKLLVTRYLRFLRNSSGVSPFAVAPVGKHDTPRIRPATAGMQRMKFGVDGNANHNYMTSDPAFSWGRSQDPRNSRNDARSKSACMNKSRVRAHHTTMERMRKIEGSLLRKRVSWIDGGDGGDNGICGYSSGIRSFSAKQNTSEKSTMISSSTQYDPDYEVPDYAMSDEVSVTSSPLPGKPQSATKQKEYKAVQPINITFPFPVTPDRFRNDEAALMEIDNSRGHYVIHNHRRGLSATMRSPQRRKA
ncbi:uncharacterized protein LOC143462941 isoform X2 [Clavelina lepadiformis]|uniref:uncharacterized protein LOC143462941 isoform X2 n=1 Tax=Clavelina lepadiformis TaxID=159417 RepID=UPI004042EDB9